MTAYRSGWGRPIDPRIPTSNVLRDLLHHAPAETITLAWLIDRLGERSFGLMLLLLGLMATLPGASVVTLPPSFIQR